MNDARERAAALDAAPLPDDEESDVYTAEDRHRRREEAEDEAEFRETGRRPSDDDSEQATSRHLEIRKVRNALRETGAKIVIMQAAIDAMRVKQIARVREIEIQETILLTPTKSKNN